MKSFSFLVALFAINACLSAAQPDRPYKGSAEFGRKLYENGKAKETHPFTLGVRQNSSN
jgi:hypothetical protein